MGMRHPREACPPIHACLHDLEEKGSLMKLALVTIVTTNLEQMRTFYQAVLQIEPQIYRGNYIEFTLESGTRVLIELEVADIDREYDRFKGLQVEWAQELTTQPWGHRAFYVRDPDGNILNVHMAVEE